MDAPDLWTAGIGIQRGALICILLARELSDHAEKTRASMTAAKEAAKLEVCALSGGL